MPFDPYQDNGHKIVLRDDRVTVVRSEVVGEVNFEDFAKSFLSRMTAFSTERLPKNCAFFGTSSDKQVYVIEREPERVLLTCDIKARNPRNRKVQTPWQYFIFTFVRVRPNALGIEWKMEPPLLFWAQRKLRGIDDRILIPGQIPNIDQVSGKICLGNLVPNSVLIPAARMDEVVTNFYTPSSVFNADMGWQLPNRHQSILQWSEESRLDPACYLRWSDWARYRDLGYTYSLTRYMPNAAINQPLTAELLRQEIRRSFGVGG